MAGGFGSRRGRKKTRQGPNKGSSTKRKAVTDDTNADQVVGLRCVTGGEGAPAVARPGDGKTAKKRLPDAEVQWILSQERREFAPDASDVPDAEVLRRGVEAFHVLSADFFSYQAEVRAEYEAKGYVEVEDDFFERREEKRQWIREELVDLFDGVDFSDVPFSDHYYADLYSHGDEEEESSVEEE